MVNQTLKQLFLLIASYIALMLVIDYADIDMWLAKSIFQLEGMNWSLKHHWITEGLIHKGGRLLNNIALIIVLALTAYWHIRNSSEMQRGASRRLCFSLALSFISINALKAVTNVDCPWDLSLFGGDMPYIPLLADKPDSLSIGKCFPAGHASAGYAWVCLYYFFQRVSPRWKNYGLFAGLAAGLTFGIGQQLRGAHFLSHDVTTLFICSLIAFVTFNYGANSNRAAQGVSTNASFAHRR